jgi:transposase
MDRETTDGAPGVVRVQVIEDGIVRQIRALAQVGWGANRIARATGVHRDTVRRYLRGGVAAEVQVRPGARRLSDEQRRLAGELLATTAEGNGVVVKQLLAERGVDAALRTVQRAMQPLREEATARALATVRFETAPGHQLQIDFGEKQVVIAGESVKVYLFVAVLGYSRRIFVRASLSQKQDDWREGLASAFRHFGGVPQRLLIDNAGAMVIGRDGDHAVLHPAFAAFCKDWGVAVSACRPYRARTKGKTERGVGYAKHNGLAGRAFASFTELDAHLAHWCIEADQRLHGTTHERPVDRFERDERAALGPLPARPLPVRERRVMRKVAADCFVDVDRVRYSVPHRLVRRSVEVLVGETEVRVYFGGDVVAVHARSREPFQRVADPTHLDGLWKRSEAVVDLPAVLAAHGRSLEDYGAIVDALGGAS